MERPCLPRIVPLANDGASSSLKPPAGHVLGKMLPPRWIPAKPRDGRRHGQALDGTPQELAQGCHGNGALAIPLPSSLRRREVRPCDMDSWQGRILQIFWTIPIFMLYCTRLHRQQVHADMSNCPQWRVWRYGGLSHGVRCIVKGSALFPPSFLQRFVWIFRTGSKPGKMHL
ncbi:MAG: hypothetical protein RLZZ165_1460 [Bacteroidota bacterium]